MSPDVDSAGYKLLHCLLLLLSLRLLCTCKIRRKTAMLHLQK